MKRFDETDEQWSRRLDREARWAMLGVFVIFAGAVFVGIVKFLAWWRIAFD